MQKTDQPSYIAQCSSLTREMLKFFHYFGSATKWFCQVHSPSWLGDRKDIWHVKTGCCCVCGDSLPGALHVL